MHEIWNKLNTKGLKRQIFISTLGVQCLVSHLNGVVKHQMIAQVMPALFHHQQWLEMQCLTTLQMNLGFLEAKLDFLNLSLYLVLASLSLFILLFLLTLAWSTYLLSLKKFTLIGCCLDGSSRIWRGLPTEFWLCWKVDW